MTQCLDNNARFLLENERTSSVFRTSLWWHKMTRCRDAFSIKPTRRLHSRGIRLPATWQTDDPEDMFQSAGTDTPRYTSAHTASIVLQLLLFPATLLLLRLLLCSPHCCGERSPRALTPLRFVWCRLGTISLILLDKDPFRTSQSGLGGFIPVRRGHWLPQQQAVDTTIIPKEREQGISFSQDFRLKSLPTVVKYRVNVGVYLVQHPNNVTYSMCTNFEFVSKWRNFIQKSRPYLQSWSLDR